MARCCREQDLARAATGNGDSEPPSVLKSLYHDASGNDALLAAWIVSEARDGHVTLGRRAAVKMLLPELSSNQDIVSRFFNEVPRLSDEPPVAATAVSSAQPTAAASTTGTQG